MDSSEDLLILGIGVSEHKCDGVLRFEHFCRVFNLAYRILGDGKKWYGGEMAAGMGGGQKINEVIIALQELDNQLVIICDTFDLFPVASKTEIMDKYSQIRSNKNQVIFSSEVYCWPDKKLASSYPQVTTKYKFLNSGSIMGYSNDIYNLIKNGNVKDNDDDQLFFTKKYLENANIKLDNKCEIFQAINGAYDDIIFHKNRVYNKYTNSYPIFLHGNGPAKLFLNKLENYIDPYGLTGPTNYSYTMEPVKILNHEPKIFFAIYIDSSAHDAYKTFFDSFINIQYTNKVMHIYDSSNSQDIQQLMQMFQIIYHGDTAVNSYVYDDFRSSDCEYYFLLEQRCVITNTNFLHELVPLCNDYHRIISPLLYGVTNKAFTNYWGDIDGNGYYRRADDYFSIIEREKRGLWNAPYISGAILIHASIINNYDLSKKNSFNDRDMSLCCNLRKETLFMYTCNLNSYGYLQ